jgi:hypothetical protein
MNDAKCFDIHDRDITPEIYTLLFCDAFVELAGNDQWYKIHPFGDEYDDDDWKIYPATEYQKSAEEQFSIRLRRGWKNCYHNEEAMKNLYENPCTCQEAIDNFKKWLIERDVTKNTQLFVKLWW